MNIKDKNRVKWEMKHPIFLLSRFDRKYFGSFFNRNLPAKCECSFCGRKFHNYVQNGYASELVEREMVLNMGPRFGQCPYCDSKDKYRWLWYIIENHTDILQSNGRLLHFAPEQPIKVKMDAEFHGEYVSCDLVEGRADQVIDMTNMGGCKNESYDYIIACNVLEHIPNEKKALEELKRVVKLGGLVILTFPIAMQIEKTYENSSIVSDEERLKVYGQEDHVRLYGKDYIERLESYGFKVNSYFPKDVMSEAEIRKNGFMQVAPIIILKK